MTPLQSLLDRKKSYELIVVGGSAGSFPIVLRMLEHLPKHFRLPLAMCLHRLKDKREGFKEALEIKSQIPVVEPDDKADITGGVAFVAPANYHLLVNEKGLFGLATTELVQYSRPSIDVLFESAADAYGPALIAIILSGANRDGAQGMRRVKARGGVAIVQNPAECGMATMPEAALQAVAPDAIMGYIEIIHFLKHLHD